MSKVVEMLTKRLFVTKTICRRGFRGFIKYEQVMTNILKKKTCQKVKNPPNTMVIRPCLTKKHSKLQKNRRSG